MLQFIDEDQKQNNKALNSNGKISVNKLHPSK